MAVRTSPPTHVEDLSLAWGAEPPAEERIAFLALPARRRTIALARIAALRELSERPERPSRAEQERIARRLGVGLKRLQGLMRDWSRDPSISVATPLAEPVRRSAGRRPERAIAERIVAKALARRSYVAEPSLHRRITGVLGRLGMKAPARMTVRRMLEDARRFLPSTGFIDAPSPASAADTDSTPLSPGELLVLADAWFEARVIQDDGSETQGSALLLIDMDSAFILAAAPANAPESMAAGAREALLGGTSFAIGPWTTPRRLLLGTEIRRDWVDRIGEACRTSGVAVEQTQRRLIRRWLTSSLWQGFDRLVPTARRRLAADKSLPEDWPALQPAEFAEMLDRAVDRNRAHMERVFSGTGPLKGNAELAAVLERLFTS